MDKRGRYLNQFDRATTCRSPRGTAENFNRLEEMRKDVFFFLSVATTDPDLDKSSLSENEIQEVADRLKAIRIKRAEAMKDAHAKGWIFLYDEGESDLERAFSTRR